MRWIAMRMMTGALAVVMVGSAAPVSAQTGLRMRERESRTALEAARAELAAARPALARGAAGAALMRPALDAARARLEIASVQLAGAQVDAAMSRAARSAERASVGRRSLDLAPPAPWLQEDPAGPLYQRAREALNRRRYTEAAEQFAEIRAQYPRSGYVADSFYWQAFALARAAGPRQLREAAELLSVQAADHPDAATRRDADELRVRIEAQLARRGDAGAAAVIAQQASGPCGERQEVRLAALSALLNMNADQAVPILQEVLKSRDECSVELRRRAVFLVAQKMTDESVDILLDLAHRNPDPDQEVREQAIFWLHQVPGPEALEALEAILLETDDPELQERAIFAISQRSGDARAVQVLKSYAERSDIDSDLRANAIFWISQNPDAGGAAYLIELYPRLDDAELKERVVFGVSQSPTPEGRAWLFERARDRNESMEIRKNALFWVGQMGGVRAADLQQIYGTLEDAEMKEQLIFVASQTGESEAVDFLMGIARDERDRELRERAIFWLGQSNDARVAEFLLTLIRG